MYDLILILYEGVVWNVIICFMCQGHLEVKTTISGHLEFLTFRIIGLRSYA